jgi:DNA-binding CsgD family transcriptional regulator
VGRVCAAASYNLAWLAHWGEAVEMSQRGLVASGKRMNPDRGRLLGMAGCMTAWAGQYQAGNEMIDEELHLADQLGDGNLLAHALSMRALARHIHMEYREVVEAGRRATKVLNETGDLWTLASVTGFMAFGLVYLGRFDEFPALDREFGPLAERLGNDGAIMCFRRMRALIDYFTTGDLDRLDALAHADREFCESAGLPWVSSAWSWAALARFLRGDWDHALELFREAVRLEPPGILSGWNVAPLFECLAYRGEKDAAMGLLDERDLPGPGEPKPWGATAMLVTAVDGLVVLGERDRAAALYPSVVDVMDRTGTVCSAYDDARLCERAAGIAAMAGRRWEAAEAHFRRALHQAAELPHRPEQAHTRRWYGQMLLERSGPGDRYRAEKILHQAFEDYRHMGMPRHCELAALRSRLGDVAAQTTPVLGKSRFPDSLTTREVEVLQNIAGGLTSGELAAKLHLSVATVHKHIANIYGKIGARNRAEATAYAFTHQLADPGDT